MRMQDVSDPRRKRARHVTLPLTSGRAILGSLWPSAHLVRASTFTNARTCSEGGVRPAALSPAGHATGNGSEKRPRSPGRTYSRCALRCICGPRHATGTVRRTRHPPYRPIPVMFDDLVGDPCHPSLLNAPPSPAGRSRRVFPNITRSAASAVPPWEDPLASELLSRVSICRRKRA